MSRLLPNQDQKQLLSAVGRVLQTHAKDWHAERSGNPLADLQAAARELSKMVGRGSDQEGDAGPGIRKFWGWGYEGEGPGPLMVEVFLEFLKARFGLEGFEDVPAPSIDDIELRPPRFALSGELSEFCSDAKLD